MSIREALAGPLAGMAAYRQFIIYKLVPSKRPGKMDKLPCDISGNVSSAHNAAIWMDAATAVGIAEMFGEGWGVGFVFTESDPFWFLDMDKSLVGGQWSSLALQIFQHLPGCAAEISGSLQGGHIFGRGTPPAHGCKNEALGLEFYHMGRFVALTGIGAIGDCNTDMTPALPALVAAYFQPDAHAGAVAEWSEGPVAEWKGPADDAELIRRAMRPTANSAFGGKAGFGDLWTANAVVLGQSYPDVGGRDYNESAADAALAQHLAFWTGKDCARIERMMRQSALVRDKWDSHATYMERTILGAVARQEAVLGDKDKALTAPAVGVPVTGSLTVPSGSPSEMTPDDFWAHLPSHKYYNRGTREPYSVDAINGHLRRFSDGLGMKPAAYLDMFRAVQQMSWHPGYPEIIEGMVSDNGTLRADPKGRIYNRFRESDAVASNADPSPWVNHMRHIYPDDWEYLISWMAYRIQNPGAKINHAIVLGGVQGTGKDFILAPLRYGVGAANEGTVKPTGLFSEFTSYVEKTLLVINEARDLGDENRYSFYETTKPLIAGPPDTLNCNLKGITSYEVPNVMAVVITTNNKLNGLYLPPDDRRHYVAWSHLPEKPSDDYFDPLWDWMLEGGGKAAVLGYLKTLSISKFRPKGDPPKTEAWKQIVAASINPEEISMSDAAEGIQLATVKELIAALKINGHMELAQTLEKNTRKIPHILERIGLELLPNPAAKSDGRWRLGDGRKETLYVSKDLPLAERLRLAQARVAAKV